MDESNVTHIFSDQRGFLWIGTAEGEIYQFDGQSFKKIAALGEPLEADQNAFRQEAIGLIKISTEKNNYQYQNGSLLRIKEPVVQADTFDFGEKKNIPEHKIIRTFSDKAGSFLLFFRDRAPGYYFPARELFRPLEDMRFPSVISDGLKEDRGNWVISKFTGVHFLENGDSSWHVLSNFPSSPNQLNCIGKDAMGQVWIGTRDKGIFKVINPNFKSFERGDNFPNNAITSIVEQKDSSIWLGTKEGNLLFVEDERFIKYNNHSGYLTVGINDLISDADSRLWLGLNGKGIALLDSLGLYKIFTKEQGLASNYIRHLHQSDDNTIWASMYDKGLAKININAIDSNEYFSIESIANPILKNTTALASRKNQLWIGNASGRIIRINEKGENLKILDTSFGLPGGEILSINLDKYPLMIASIAGKGIYQCDLSSGAIKFQQMERSKSLRSRNIRSISRMNGSWWFAHERGLDRVGKDGEIQFFGKSQGVDIGIVNSTLPASRLGQLIAGGNDGILFINPGGGEAEKIKPTAYIESIDLFYESLINTEYSEFIQANWQASKDLTFKAKDNHLGFGFSGHQINFPENIKFQWQLSPLEKEWSPLSKRQSVNYANLPAGKYNFQVRSSIDGNRFSTPASVQFKISQPLWKRTWFLISAILLLIAIISAVIQNYIRGVKKKASAKAERLGLENRLLNLNQKALQLQMNPHYIFNTLNSINALVARGDNQEARVQINTFARQLRSTLSNSRSETISLEKEIESLDQYLKMLQFSHSSQFTFEIVSGKELDPEEVELPPMLIQPFVENAVLHGFNQLNKTGEILIRFTKKGLILQCEVIDNGIGRKAAASNKKDGHTSHALDVTRERLESLKGQLKYNCLEIIDLEDQGKALGTKVILQLPYVVNY